MGLNVSSFVRSLALRDAGRIALVEGETGDAITYGELDARARHVAGALAKEGLRVGDRVALIGDNSVDLVAAWLGAFAAGLVVLPLPPMSAPPEITARVRHARCRAVIADDACATRVHEAVPELPRFAPAALGAFETPVSVAQDLPSDALAMLLYTSGTTGAPRGVMITHASLITHTASIVHHVLALGREDVVAGFLPLSHSYGVRMTLLAPFYAGARTVLLPRFNARRALDVARREGVTWWPMVPTMASAIGRERDAHVASLRFVTSAGAPLSPEVRERAEAALACPVRDAYGMTEATFTSLDVPGPDEDAGVGTVGRPVPGVEVVILSEDGLASASGTLGEIAVRGQNVTAGYFEDEAATRAALTPEGFFRSGDLGYLDTRGRLIVVDRIKDLIVRGGFNVVPAEVEAVLARHQHVLEVAVVGIPDTHLGEEIVAVVHAAQTISTRELDEFVRASLSPTKVPRRYAFVQTLPVGSSGKIMRRVLRDAIITNSIALELVLG
jgi:long-chain acyl-CoA synthetase